MNPKWIIALSFVFICGAILCNILDQLTPLGNSGTTGTATYYIDQCINNFKLVTSGGIWEAIKGVVLGIGSFLTALGHMFIWDYNFLKEGAYNIVRWVVFMPFSFGLGWIILTYVIPSMVSTIRSIF